MSFVKNLLPLTRYVQGLNEGFLRIVQSIIYSFLYIYMYIFFVLYEDDKLSYLSYFSNKYASVINWFLYGIENKIVEVLILIICNIVKHQVLRG